ncbi:hypothetical protein B7P34_04695 [Streptosporangium nondiastaticum]|uniref:Uncharacterized protein n=1 Tax=Streptosporangium nondiastaticum TaxID=35764 RepID=A0A9X7PJ57_9ACTN|nr:hypothetical protein [Streptosporangium nondiastaticum]PSJ29813.1 hypothetical protein B7P34_04695 [Streptosporangium nondiastaticum]
MQITIPPYPIDEDHAPLLLDITLAETSRAADIAEGDVILGAVDEQGRVDYFNDYYRAAPMPYDPTCGCGVCYLAANDEGPVVNLGNDNPWDTCDPHHADARLVIIRAAHLA